MGSTSSPTDVERLGCERARSIPEGEVESRGKAELARRARPRGAWRRLTSVARWRCVKDEKAPKWNSEPEARMKIAQLMTSTPARTVRLGLRTQGRGRDHGRCRACPTCPSWTRTIGPWASCRRPDMLAKERRPERPSARPRGGGRCGRARREGRRGRGGRGDDTPADHRSLRRLDRRCNRAHEDARSSNRATHPGSSRSSRRLRRFSRATHARSRSSLAPAHDTSSSNAGRPTSGPAATATLQQ